MIAEGWIKTVSHGTEKLSTRLSCSFEKRKDMLIGMNREIRHGGLIYLQYVFLEICSNRYRPATKRCVLF